ncbi:MAG TPA: hypothetical protein PLJ71_17695 [Candidatus Hydrogenedentes bacterium]|nr:hypothetical protein [Candidatus Hydrogenedentota bacterium]HQM50526.1 hypothetical protein [Candidatus Hydrogenedentota bacterium]
MAGMCVACQLRSYIAPGCPATRAPCDGSEAPLRVEFGFTPRWYRSRCGIDFGERWHLDPLYRGETILKMRAALNHAFPAISWRKNEAVAVPNIDGVHGGLTVTRLFGIPVEYYADNWPAALLEFLPRETIRTLSPPDLSNHPLFEQLESQMDCIEREAGRIEGYINWQGVLNSAYRIRGPEVFTDLLTDPGLAHHLFETVTETMIAGMRRVYERQRATGVNVRHATVSNCLVNMVSPGQYHEHLMPYDRRLAQAFEIFGIHNCAWNVDPYIDDYASFPNLAYVDMGLDSKLDYARQACPHARRAIMYTPRDLATKSEAQLRRDLGRIYRELGPCDVVMADIDDNIPGQRVAFFAQAALETAR